MTEVYECIAVARPRDANQGPVRVRLPEQVAAIVRMVSAGVSPSIAAKAYGVSARTVYRYMADASLAEQVVAVGGWTAVFVMDAGVPPRRVSRWTRS